MAVFIRWSEVETGKFKVTFYHNYPEMLTLEEMQGGVIVDSLPSEPDFEEGKRVTGLFVDPSTISYPVDYNVVQTNVNMWYEVEDIPLTAEQLVQQLIERVSILESEKVELDTKFAEVSGQNESLESSNKSLSDTVDGLIIYLAQKGII